MVNFFLLNYEHFVYEIEKNTYKTAKANFHTSLLRISVSEFILKKKKDDDFQFHWILLSQDIESEEENQEHLEDIVSVF